LTLGGPVLQDNRHLFFKKELKVMDKIIRFTLGVLLVILIAFLSLVSYQVYVERAYVTSLSGTYSYRCTITTDSPLTNVTLFIPVPADPAGNSPVVAGFSAGEIGGVPAGWDVTLYDTGKATLVKVTVPAIMHTERTGPSVFRMAADLQSPGAIDTRDPINTSAMFRPVGDVMPAACASGPAAEGSPVCHHYTTSLYADYEAPPGASVNISATLVGRNTWHIFGPGSNEYDTAVSLQMSGPHQGWATMTGTLTDHIGMYDVPEIPAGYSYTRHPVT
jgi:hypothetical protein